MKMLHIYLFIHLSDTTGCEVRIEWFASSSNFKIAIYMKCSVIHVFKLKV